MGRRAADDRSVAGRTPGRAHRVVLLVLASAVAACAADLVVRGAMGVGLGDAESARELLARAGGLLWGSVEAGVVEEALFRGVVLFAVLALVQRTRLAQGDSTFAMRVAIGVSTAAFALAHVASSWPGDAASALDVTALTLKFVQAALFGFCMAGVTVARRSLMAPVLAHIGFDLLYFAPTYFAQGAFPATYAAFDAVSFAALVASSALLLAASVECAKMMQVVFASSRFEANRVQLN